MTEENYPSKNLLESLPPDQLANLSSILEPRSYPAGTRLMEEGESVIDELEALWLNNEFPDASRYIELVINKINRTKATLGIVGGFGSYNVPISMIQH